MNKTTRDQVEYVNIKLLIQDVLAYTVINRLLEKIFEIGAVALILDDWLKTGWGIVWSGWRLKCTGT